jgi:Fe-S oxidoreductase
MTYQPTLPAYWDPVALEKDMRRIFQYCIDCRMCVNLCHAFPELFKRVDAKGEDAGVLVAADLQAVIDLCNGCKLCYPKCPYTPPHAWNLDFPRLILRAKAVQARRSGIPLRERMLSRPETIGSLSRPLAPIVNVLNRHAGFRAVLEKIAGIHRETPLPEYHRETFATWVARRGTRPPGGEPAGRVALFYTCAVNYNSPEVGRAAVEVLERNRVEIRVPRQVCCGMPNLDCGDVEAATAAARQNIAALHPLVQAGYEIITPGPTCSLMLRQEYPLLADTPEARQVAAHTLDLCEYLMRLHAEGKLDTEFQGRAGAVVYHLPCHLKAQNIGYKSRDLMQLAGAAVQVIERCCGHDGTWSMRTPHFAQSIQMGRRLFEAIREAGASSAASDCLLAQLQIQKATGILPLHPIQVIHRAYGLGGDMR